jgi:hypothetical protein
MNNLYKSAIICFVIIPFFGFTQSELKIESNRVVAGETFNYKATWGFLTIGSASTKIDKGLYKVGSNICYKVDIAGHTNGLAKLFYVHDTWTSYIDTASITTHKSTRSIREGGYALDEEVYFDHCRKKATVKVYDKKSMSFVLKKIYDTPENIRDVVAGFMVFRLVDLSKYAKGEVFTVNGFYEDEGYSVKVVFQGAEYIKTDFGKMLCYRVQPLMPKNNLFDGKDALTIWLSANNSQSIMRIKSKMFIGNIQIDMHK